MTQNKNQNILHTWMLIMYVVMLISSKMQIQMDRS